MILDRFKELNLSEEEINQECVIFNQIYTEYIRDDVKTKRMSTYISKTPDKPQAVSGNIIKNLKKNDDTYNNHQYATKYGHKEKEKTFTEKVKQSKNYSYGTKSEFRRSGYNR
jgi:hypothetical protein